MVMVKKSVEFLCGKKISVLLAQDSNSASNRRANALLGEIMAAAVDAPTGTKARTRVPVGCPVHAVLESVEVHAKV